MVHIDRVVAVDILQAPAASMWAVATSNRALAVNGARPYAPVERGLPALAGVARKSEPLQFAKHGTNPLRFANAGVQQVPEPGVAGRAVCVCTGLLASHGGQGWWPWGGRGFVLSTPWQQGA